MIKKCSNKFLIVGPITLNFSKCNWCKVIFSPPTPHPQGIEVNSLQYLEEGRPLMVPYSPLINTCTETLSWNKGFSDGEICVVILDSVFALWFYRVHYKSKPSHFTSLTPKWNGNKSFSPFLKINFAMDPTCSAFKCSG